MSAFPELIPNITSSISPIIQLQVLNPNAALLSQSPMDACQGTEPATHQRWLIRGDTSERVNFRFFLVSVSRTRASLRVGACSSRGCRLVPCVYLLQHHSLLLLEQGLELLRGENLLLEDLLHLLRCDHLGTHHGHRHWNLDREGGRDR